MSICAETQGCFEIDFEPGEPNANCVYARLIRLGYTVQSLASADGKDGLPMNYLYRLARPDTLQEADIGKMHPQCQKLVSIIQKCEIKISAKTANEVISEDEKTLTIRHISGKQSGDSDEKRKRLPRSRASQMGGSGKGPRAKWGGIL